MNKRAIIEHNMLTQQQNNYWDDTDTDTDKESAHDIAVDISDNIVLNNNDFTPIIEESEKTPKIVIAMYISFIVVCMGCGIFLTVSHNYNNIIPGIVLLIISGIMFSAGLIICIRSLFI